jgi:creatinine amidohydrolase/Fe(II)-dependent formamide hydrolase-like protein
VGCSAVFWVAVTTSSARAVLAAALIAAGSAAPACAAGPARQLEALTWTELRDRVAAGTTTVLVPIGGTEQNGPHMALGKHNRRALLLAERIADRLGNALVAPVLAYVPEGSIEPPSQHMRWPGTISVPAPAFEAMLEAAARSLHRAGFVQVVLLGDHGGYRASLERVARRVPGVIAPPEYYRGSTEDFARELRGQGFDAAEIGSHAGLADTALMLALDESLVRLPIGAPRLGDGTSGDARRASAALARATVEQLVTATAAAIERHRAERKRQSPP